LESLHGLAQQGKINALNQVLDDLAQETKDYHPCIAPIKLRLQEFNLVAVRQLLKTAIAEPMSPQITAGAPRNAP
ncbi:MAG: hypothetical protein ACK58N_07495, partial [Synechocystis sp.]